MKQLVITFDGEKAFKKKLDPIVETLQFDERGQNTEEKYVSKLRRTSLAVELLTGWLFDLVNCENAVLKQLDGGYTCHDGVIDSMME
ncbi:MAG: hypothetical protein U0176_12910 [Bacteroidia bacterium]